MGLTTIKIGELELDASGYKGMIRITHGSDFRMKVSRISFHGLEILSMGDVLGVDLT